MDQFTRDITKKAHEEPSPQPETAPCETSQGMRLEEHPFFDQLDPRQVVLLIRHTDVLALQGGQMIFDEGAESDCLYLVLDGKVGFSKKIEAGQYRAVSSAGPGSFFGEIGLYTGDARALRATAEDRCLLGRIPKQVVLDLIRNTPGPIHHILENIVTHLHGTTRHYIDDVLQQQKIAIVGSMVNTIIHDFKNPFMIISLGAQVMAQMHDDPQTQKICKNMEAQVNRMVEMAEELSLFAKGSTELKLETVRARSLYSMFKDLNFPFFEHERIRITDEIEDVEFQAEPGKCIRVLQNLVGNAIEAYGEKPGEIRITAKKDGAMLLLTIADDAGGIPEPIRNQFFEPFVTHGKSRGTGLGTAIVKNIVLSHRGTIDFETETGKGTTFVLRLPLQQGA